MLGDQYQRLDRGAPSERVVLALGQLGDESAVIAQCAQLAASGRRDRIIEGAVSAAVRHLSLVRASPLAGPHPGFRP
jgi:hypothetical protein